MQLVSVMVATPTDNYAYLSAGMSIDADRRKLSCINWASSQSNPLKGGAFAAAVGADDECELAKRQFGVAQDLEVLELDTLDHGFVSLPVRSLQHYIADRLS
jgi:hypothetical protein